METRYCLRSFAMTVSEYWSVGLPIDRVNIGPSLLVGCGIAAASAPPIRTHTPDPRMPPRTTSPRPARAGPRSPPSQCVFCPKPSPWRRPRRPLCRPPPVHPSARYWFLVFLTRARSRQGGGCGGWGESGTLAAREDPGRGIWGGVRWCGEQGLNSCLK